MSLNGLYGPAMTLMSYPSHRVWCHLAKTVNQTTLDNAYTKMPEAQALFEPAIGPLHPRSCKKESRIRAKFNQVESRDGQFFKVVSDFIAFRHHCKVTEIDSKIVTLANIVARRGGTMQLKGNFRSGPFQTYTDIVQYVYVFVPEFEHIIEFQIGSSFASYVFTIDSKLRDDPTCGEIDLWTDNTYETVKQYLLVKANNTLHQCNTDSFSGDCSLCKYTPTRYDAWVKVDTLFNHNIPQELRKVLEELN